jgi:hypothetical protein
LVRKEVTGMRWVGIVAMVFGIAALIFGIVIMMASNPGFFTVGLALISLGIGIALTGFILFGLITELAKMAPS